MHKVWFYIALSSVVVAGVWLSVPDEAQQRQLQEEAAPKKVDQQQKLPAGGVSSAAGSD